MRKSDDFSTFKKLSAAITGAVNNALAFSYSVLFAIESLDEFSDFEFETSNGDPSLKALLLFIEIKLENS